MPIPLYGFLEGDTLGLIVLAEEDETVLQLARKLQDAASVRVVRRENCSLVYNDKVIDPTLTIMQAGLRAMDRIDVRWRETP